MIHRETAQKKGIHEGDSVYIETKRGRIQQKARLTSDIDPRVIIAEFGWWDPEKAPNDSKRWANSNVNILTDDKTPFNRAMGAANELGSPTLKGLFCNVYK
jgi:anaerobic selenocysteine-containing dehydrogenase